MTGTISDYGELKILEHMVGKTSFTMPTVVAIALVTTLPTDASTGATLVEPSTSGTAYARKTLTPSTDFASAGSGQIQNAAIITMATATGNGWGAIVGWALCDSASVGAGNVIAWGSINLPSTTTPTTKTILAGDTASFAVNDITITLD